MGKRYYIFYDSDSVMANASNIRKPRAMQATSDPNGWHNWTGLVDVHGVHDPLSGAKYGRYDRG